MNSNRLKHEKSPYLLQHQHNPVDWFPWGAEAFAKAVAEQKPIFLSIGYSTCHWCHVMERESFENEGIAALLNKDFISIKVDREERPDVDRVYMTFVQATTGSGGWPMSVFLTPDLKPFLGGTYYPPHDRWGRPGFSTLLGRIAELWHADRAKILMHGEQALESLIAYTEPADEASQGSLPVITPAALQNAYQRIAQLFDAELGGFSNSPKFPRPVTLNFLFRFFARQPDSAEGKHALKMALHTLDKMAAGGMHDHLGGGFHRYSVDRFWHVPHFEKMLYDQAQLACSYLEAYQITQEPQYAQTLRTLLDYVRREMTHPNGGFFSAEDADSLPPEGGEEKAEGAFYVWTEAEIREVLDPGAADLFIRIYGVEPQGNSPEGSDPHGELTGKNTLIQRHTVHELAQALHTSEAEVIRSLDASKQTLFEQRAARPRPHLDDKVITAWNGLMISAFARAWLVLENPAYLESAKRAAAFIHDNLYANSRLKRSFREGASAADGFADDYAFLIQGLLDLYEATGELRWLKWACELQTTHDALFYDEAHGGWFSTSGQDPAILLRMKEDYDGAEPSHNSVAVLNALRLSQVLDDPSLRSRAEGAFKVFGTQIRNLPHAAPQLLCAVDAAFSANTQVVLVGTLPTAAETGVLNTHALAQAVHTAYQPNRVILFKDDADGTHWLGERLPFLREMKPVNGQAAAYICQDFTCQSPVTTKESVKAVMPNFK